MNNQWDYYEILEGRAFAVVFRDKGAEEIKLCPFCGDTHRHNKGHSDYPSHTHCGTGKFFKEVVAPDGTVMRKEDGYIIRER